MITNRCCHICKTCKKSYASYKSLWNHNKKYHPTDNTIVSPNVSSNVSSNTLKCKYCYCIFIHRSSKSRHEKKCLEINPLIKENNLLKKELGDIKNKITKIINKTNNITNNITKNNNIINNNFTINVNFDINSIGYENLEDLMHDEKKEILTKTGESITKYIELVNFNKYLPTNHSFCVSDLKSKYLNVYNNKHKRVDKYRKKYFFDELSQKIANKIQDIYNLNPDIKANNTTVKNNITLANKFFDNKLCKELHNNIESIAYNNKELVKETWNGKNNNNTYQLILKIRKLIDLILSIKICKRLKIYNL